MKLRIHFRLQDPTSKTKVKYLDLSDQFTADEYEDKEDIGWYHADVNVKPCAFAYQKNEAQCFRANGFIDELCTRLTCRLLDTIGFTGKKIKDDKEYYIIICKTHIYMRSIRDALDFVSIDLYENEMKNVDEVSAYLNLKLRRRHEDSFYSYWAEVI